ncbi:hypothetical protein AX17_001770 [Amanita inopinata Kibby_2008]|nr:hypothetical protein AX17_001770 [Amanita inopinata Kibby_2008]
MYSLNRGEAVGKNEVKNDLPVIPLLEDSKTLHFLLSIIYPYDREPVLDDVHLIWKVGKAVQKYAMDLMQSKLRKWMLAPDSIDKEPLRVYATAANPGWHDITEVAAEKVWKTPLNEFVYVDELQIISGADFYRFLDYKFRLRKASEPQLKTLLRIVSPVFDKMFPLKDNQKMCGLPIIPVAEDSETIDNLLKTIYHYIDEPDVQDVDVYSKVVMATQKYKMVAIVEKFRKRPLQQMDNVDYLEAITAANLFRLVKYRFKCADAACKVMNDNRLTLAYGHLEYYSNRSETDVDVIEDLRACPRGMTIANAYTAKLEWLKKSIGNCSVDIKSLERRDTTIAQIEEAVAKVPIDVETEGVESLSHS